MRKYCKAYHLKDLRQFPAWRETSLNEDASLTDETVVYLWDDFTVVLSPIVPEKGVLWDTATQEWQHFCRDTLHFEIPEDLRYAYEQTQESESSEQRETNGTQV